MSQALPKVLEIQERRKWAKIRVYNLHLLNLYSLLFFFLHKMLFFGTCCSLQPPLPYLVYFYTFP